MRSLTRLTLCGVALAAVAAAVLTVQTATGSRASAPTCTASQLKGKELDSNGAAGTILFSVTLQNKGSACKLKGYPGLRIRGAHGLLPTHVVHGGMSMLNGAPKLVKLARLDKASVLISFEDVPVGGETSCPAGTAIRLRPPGASDWLTVKVRTSACGHGTLHESPLLAGVHSSQ
ncbi:MAG: DUF4232 domain-containing protein [Gaiellaceae bacterium]